VVPDPRDTGSDGVERIEVGLADYRHLFFRPWLVIYAILRRAFSWLSRPSARFEQMPKGSSPAPCPAPRPVKRGAKPKFRASGSAAVAPIWSGLLRKRWLRELGRMSQRRCRAIDQKAGPVSRWQFGPAARSQWRRVK
jgi:hypothetical protein